MKTPLFASRLKTLREGAGLTQSDLARILQPLSPQAVQKWETGSSAPRRSKWRPLADALNTTVSNVIQGTELEEFPQSESIKAVNSGRVFTLRSTKGGAPTKESGAIPLISWAQAAEWGSRMGSIKAEEAQDWLQCPFAHGPAAFILEVAGESNYDPGRDLSFSPGNLIYVDPAREPSNRDMVVIRIDNQERAQLKQLLMDEDGKRLLKSLNPNWPDPIATMAGNVRIIGTVIGKWVGL
jgi:SOS-response transcriptional repressor LexA